MNRALDIIQEKLLILTKKCFTFVWLLCRVASQSLVNLAVIVFVIAAVLVLINISKHIVIKAPIDEAELRLIEKNSEALEESFLKNCTVSKEYSLNELVPFEWSKVYFIEAAGDIDPFNPEHDYNTNAKKIRKIAGYDWGGYIPDMVDASLGGVPYAHTHILFMNGRKVVAYLPYNLHSEPAIIRLYKWAEGEFISSNDPSFFIEITDEDTGSRSFVLSP